MLLLFSVKITAQEPVKPKVMPPSVGAAPQNAPRDIIEQYQAILKPYKLDTKEGWNSFHKKITAADRQRLEALYKQMSLEQQDKQVVGFMPPPTPSPKAVPSEKLFAAFKDPNKYGVWVDDKKVPNEKLNNYTATDFSHYDISKLYGAAKQGRSYTHQLNLMTNAYYQAYYKDAISRKENIMYTKWMSANIERRMVVRPDSLEQQ